MNNPGACLVCHVRRCIRVGKPNHNRGTNIAMLMRREGYGRSGGTLARYFRRLAAGMGK